jgi:predicted ester cyclase
MGDDELERTYSGYVAAIRERRFDDLDQFVHDQLIYNGEQWTREKYQSLLTDIFRRTPDLDFRIEVLVIGADHVACRLWFDGSPQQEFLGIDAGGRRVAFAEHAFYRFRAGRIEHVWSLVDADSIRRQLSGTADQ